MEATVIAMTEAQLITMLQSLPTDHVTRLLPRLGYRQGDELPGRGYIFESTDGDQLAVPTNKKFRDYGKAVLNLLETLPTSVTTLDDLVAMLVLPDCDIYRHKFDDDFSKWGSFPLDSFNEAIPVLVDLYSCAQGSASAVWNHVKWKGLPVMGALYEQWNVGLGSAAAADQG